jgi:uroporphyrinogen III methyltransferase/synthase
MAAGRVSFVSYGPGDRGLVGERASERIAAADVVVQPDEGRTGTELAELALAGQRVVRIVAGDALESVAVVGEVLAVVRAGARFEIVPGVGARAAAAAFAGVVGRTVRVRPDEVGRALEREPRDAVVTLVVRAGEPAQRVVVTTAGEASGRASELLPGPAEEELLVALGAPDEELRWFERRPLFGKRVLVTRGSELAGSAAALLRDEGAEAVVVPTISIEEPGDPAPLARAVAELAVGAYRWVAFTSANGVEHTWRAVEAAGGDARAFGASRLAVIGPATARALAVHGLRPDVVAAESRGEGLAGAMLAAMGARGEEGARVLLARAARARDVLPDTLRAAGCVVDVVAAYETRPATGPAVEGLAAELAAGRLDAVTFTSGSTVDHLCDALGPRAVELLGNARLASIGPVTTEAIRARGLRADVQAEETTVAGLIRALADSYTKPVA